MATLLPAEEEASGLSPPLRARLHGPICYDCKTPDTTSSSAVINSNYYYGNVILSVLNLGLRGKVSLSSSPRSALVSLIR